MTRLFLSSFEVGQGYPVRFIKPRTVGGSYSTPGNHHPSPLQEGQEEVDHVLSEADATLEATPRRADVGRPSNIRIVPSLGFTTHLSPRLPRAR